MIAPWWTLWALLTGASFFAVVGGCVATLVLQLRGSRHAARAAIILGVLVVIFGALGAISVVASLLTTLIATEAPGLSQADKQRMLANGLAESLYSLMLTVMVAAPCGLLAWRVRKRNETRV